MIRQGDILLKETKLPKNLKEKDNIIAVGEATGHSHRIMSGQVMVDTKGNQYVIANQDTELVHEEHENIKVPVGNWAVIQQREYDIHEGVRQVMD